MGKDKKLFKFHYKIISRKKSMTALTQQIQCILQKFQHSQRKKHFSLFTTQKELPI